MFDWLVGWQAIGISAEKIVHDMSEVGVADFFQIVMYTAVRLGDRDQTGKIHGCGYNDGVAIDRGNGGGEVVEL